MATKKPVVAKKVATKSNVSGKVDLIENVAKVNGLSKVKSEEVVNSVIAFITTTLKKGNAFQVIGFGAFKPVKRAARNGRNPSNGKQIKIPASISVRFAAGKKLKDTVNA